MITSSGDSQYLKSLNSSSKTAGNILLILNLGCTLSLLGIWATTDVDLFISGVTHIDLPVIKMTTPIILLYKAGPPFLLLIFFFFHLHLHHHWKYIVKHLRNVDNISTFETTIFSWLPNFLILELRNLNMAHNLINKSRLYLAIFFLFFFVPFTLLVIFLRYLSKHDWFFSFIHVTILGVSVVIGWFFFGETKKKLLIRYKRSSTNIFGFILVLISVLLTAIMIMSFSIFSKTKLKFMGLESFLYSNLEYISIVNKIDFKSNTTRTSSYLVVHNPKFFINKNLKFANVKESYLEGFDFHKSNLLGASFQQSDLRSLGFYGCILRQTFFDASDFLHVDFDSCKLQNSRFLSSRFNDGSFQNSNLYFSNFNFCVFKRIFFNNNYLEDSDFKGAQFYYSQIAHSSFNRSNLNSTLFYYVELTNSQFKGSNMSHVKFRRSILHETNFSNAFVFAADFIDCDFHVNENRTVNFSGAILNESRFENANLSFTNFHKSSLVFTVMIECDLSNADLSQANLTGMILKNVNLSEAKLKETTFAQTKLYGSDLSNALISWEQLKGCVIDSFSILPKGLSEIIEYTIE